jgi:hypothetical protein
MEEPRKGGRTHCFRKVPKRYYSILVLPSVLSRLLFILIGTVVGSGPSKDTRVDNVMIL